MKKMKCLGENRKGVLKTNAGSERRRGYSPLRCNEIRGGA